MDSDRRTRDTQTAKAGGAQEEQGLNSGDKCLTANGPKPRQAEKTSPKSREERKELPLSERGPGQGPCSPPPRPPLGTGSAVGPGEASPYSRAAEERLRGATQREGHRRQALGSPSIAAGLSIKQENTKTLQGLLP